MLCQNCKKNQASLHYKSIENGHITERHLCRECAEKSGISLKLFNPFGMIDGMLTSDAGDGILNGIFGSMIDSYANGVHKESAVCPKCGMRFSEFRRIGKVGCSECDKVFADALYPTIKQIHGNTQHNGKIPDGLCEKLTKENRLKTLKSRLAKAIELEKYEDAAHLRDEIKALESQSAQENENSNDSEKGVKTDGDNI